MAEDTKEKNYLEKEDSPEEVEEVEKEEEEKKEEEKKDTPSLARNGSWAAVWSAECVVGLLAFRWYDYAHGWCCMTVHRNTTSGTARPMKQRGTIR